MSTERSTRRREARRVMAEIKAVEHRLEAADDAELDKWTGEITKADREIVTEGTDIDADEVADNQDARANDNWPMTAAEKREVAASLLRIAHKLV